MKKAILTALGALLYGSSLQTAQAQAFEEGKFYLSGSYGIGSFYGFFANNYINSIKNQYQNVSMSELSEIKTRSFGPIYGKFEYAVSENIGIGLNIAYLDYNFAYNIVTDDGTYRTTQNYKVNRNTLSLIARMNYHFSDDKKFDPYFGFGLGYRYAHWKVTYKESSNNPNYPGSEETTPNFTGLFPFAFETTFGCRYMIVDNVGLFGEVGFAKSILQLGVTAKL